MRKKYHTFATIVKNHHLRISTCFGACAGSNSSSSEEFVVDFARGTPSLLIMSATAACPVACLSLSNVTLCRPLRELMRCRLASESKYAVAVNQAHTFTILFGLARILVKSQLSQDAQFTDFEVVVLLVDASRNPSWRNHGRKGPGKLELASESST